MDIFKTRHVAGALALCALTGQQTLARSNPLLAPSSLPYEAPRFDLIKDADYAPAFDAGMHEQAHDIGTIIANPAPPNFKNTIEALERSGQTLNRVQMTFENLYTANGSPSLDAIKTEYAPRLTKLQDEMFLNAALFKRVSSVYRDQAKAHLTAEQTRVLKDWYDAFVRAGAKLSDADKNRLKEVNARLTERESAFQQKLVAATKAGALVIDDEKKLLGLDAFAKNAAAQEASRLKLANKWVLPLQNTTQQPALAALDNRETRHELFERGWTRAERNDQNDTRALVRELALLRAEKAKLLGFKSFAAYQLQDQMAKTPEAVNAFMRKLAGPTRKAQRAEVAALQREMHDAGQTESLAAWDWDYYSDRLRKKALGYSEDELKPYFQLKTVLEDGVFYAASKLYGVTFKQRHDLPVYQPDVMVYEVFDADKSPLGLMYFDYLARDNKFGGAWMSNFVTQSKLLGQKPVIYNVGNFAKAAAGQPQLITFDDVITMFHEFGHALHGLFADQVYPSVSGTNVARDFVEFPSQFNENWALNPQVFAHYARHYQTGREMPQSLRDKLFATHQFNGGYRLGEIVAAAMLDMKWHGLGPHETVKDVDQFENAALSETGLDVTHVPPRYRSSTFLHIWGNGYEAGYYAYLWTQMLDHDAYAWFMRHGGLTRANGQRFRDTILSRGRTQDYETMFKNFYGAKPDLEPMIRFYGLN